ncbi:MAG: Na/Pi cotransporter family protein [Verrucomicrobiales bacterium]|nr:Na/Pi cotransporter family protein [Verrucomicrobiales bacterium]
MAIFFATLQILGSLGIFLYGMKVMSEGIQRVAGDGMRKVMATMTTNRFTAAFTGLITTILVQSSSATTVMVVSFVNAGLLTLFESIGVIMGANLGTTVTAWIIAAVGKFSLSKIAVPIIGIGLPFFFAGKNRVKSTGEVLIGFGLLFLGLSLLKDAVPDVKSMLNSDNLAIKEQAQAVTAWVQSLSGHGLASRFIFLALGILLTLIVQSSSAAMAITVTLAMNGWIGFEDSAAIVLGENIGTTVTAWLASIGANTNAKRAARAHFLFNVLGVLWIMLVFTWFTQGIDWVSAHLPESLRTAKHSSDIGFSLAIFHSVFNFTNILLLIGFVPLIEKIVIKWVPDTEPNARRPRLKFITQRMLDLGELNIPEAEKAMEEMGNITREMFDGYMKVFQNPDQDLTSSVKAIKELEDAADTLTHDLTEYLVRCSSSELSTKNSQAVARMLRTVSELEEICDAIYRLIKLTQRKYSKKRAFTEDMILAIQEHAAAVSDLIDLYRIKLCQNVSEEELARAIAIEEDTNRHRKQFNKAVMKQMQKDLPVQTGMLSIEMNNHLEQIADHGLHVIQLAYYETHEDQAPEKHGGTA